MPTETKQAVEWALQQSVEIDMVTHYVKDEKGNIDHHLLVDFVRQYFNDNNIEYSTFSFEDLKPYL